MSRFGSIYRRLLALFRRRQLERDLDDELSFHLAMRRADHADGGLAADEARRTAVRQFGNVGLVKERTRDAWSFPSLESWVQDVRFATRTLRRSPGFTAAAVATLSLAIGIATAMFTVVDALVLRPLPFRSPDELAFVYMGDEHGARSITVAPAVLRGWRDSGAFTQVESASPRAAVLAVGDRVVTRGLAEVTPGVFDLLGGVTPIRGRLFDADEGRPGLDDRVLLSEDVWRGLYHSDPAIVGGRVSIDGESLLVVGILPADLRFPAWNTVMWKATQFDSRPAARANERAMAYVRFDATLPRADTIRLATDAARAADAQTAGLRAIVDQIAGVERARGGRRALPLLAGAVALVFAGLCANVASLLLTRLTGRRQQFSVCSALGASRSRVLRQAFVESSLVGLLAIVAGTGMAWTFVTVARAFLPEAFLLGTLNPVNVDLRALAVASGSGILATLAAGLLPAWIATRVDAAASLRITDRSGTETRAARSMTRALLIAELALACTLLVVGTLLVRSFVNLARADRGLDVSDVLTATMSLPRTAFEGAAARTNAARAIEDAIRELPGVTAAAWSYGLPPDGGAESFGLWHSDDAKVAAIDMHVEHYNVGPEFFVLYGIPLRRGRTFLRSDDDGAVIVGERFASLLWPEQDPVGRAFRFDAERFTVIGVARETHLPSLEPARDRPEFYRQFRGVGTYAMLSVRCAGSCPNVAIVRQRVLAAQSAVQVHQVALLEDAYEEELAGPRATAALGFAFAGIAIVAAAAGLFSVLSYTVARRRLEFGIRTALGASPADIRWLVFRDGLVVAVIGIAIGTAGAWGLARALASLRYGVTMGDLPSWTFVIGLVALTTIAAAWRPAHAAARLDPVLLLRQE